MFGYPPRHPIELDTRWLVGEALPRLLAMLMAATRARPSVNERARAVVHEGHHVPLRIALMLLGGIGGHPDLGGSEVRMAQRWGESMDAVKSVSGL